MAGPIRSQAGEGRGQSVQRSIFDGEPGPCGGRGDLHNPENGFRVVRINARGQKDLIGRVAMITVGESNQASGTWVNDRTYG
jgi:hypothetical protein